mgnify:CR=1 FL=1
MIAEVSRSFILNIGAVNNTINVIREVVIPTGITMLDVIITTNFLVPSHRHDVSAAVRANAYYSGLGTTDTNLTWRSDVISVSIPGNINTTPVGEAEIVVKLNNFVIFRGSKTRRNINISPYTKYAQANKIEVYGLETKGSYVELVFHS